MTQMQHTTYVMGSLWYILLTHYTRGFILLRPSQVADANPVS